MMEIDVPLLNPSFLSFKQSICARLSFLPKGGRVGGVLIEKQGGGKWLLSKALLKTHSMPLQSG
jgi:hypothetical protein